MYTILNRYLFQHKSLPIPGLGTIYLETHSASVDASTRMALPPSYQFRFDNYFDAPDKELFAYVSQQKNVADYESLRLYNEFAYQLRDKLNLQRQVEWTGIGTIKKDDEGNISMSTSFNPYFLQSVPATKVIRSDAQHTLLVGDRERTSGEMTSWFNEEADTGHRGWWIVALSTGVAALLFILLYFSSHGWKLEATGNQQVLQTQK